MPDNVKAYDKKLVKKSDYINGKVGEFTEDDIRRLSAKNGAEYAVLTCGDTSILIRGDKTSTDISDAFIDKLAETKGTFDFHTHPFDGDIIPSLSDRNLISLLEKRTGQETSEIVSTDGLKSKYNKDGVITTGTVKKEVGEKYQQTLLELFRGD